MVLVLPVAGERCQHPRVQRRPARRGDRSLNRLAGKLVPEHQLAAVIDQHTARERVLDRLDSARRDRGEQRRRDTLAHHRSNVNDAARLHSKAPDPRQHRIPDRRRQTAARRERLDYEKRVPARQP